MHGLDKTLRGGFWPLSLQVKVIKNRVFCGLSSVGERSGIWSKEDRTEETDQARGERTDRQGQTDASGGK